MQQEQQGHGQMSERMMRHHYMMLGVNLLLSLIIMYVAMFAMIWSGNAFIQNLNFFYMALVMWAPMAIVMMLTMSMMYKNRTLNMILYAAFALVFLLSFWAIRQQGLVGDKQFVRSMIPHHSGAILMCNRASIRDAEVRELCFKPNGIVDSQTREIEQMNRILERL